MLRHFVRERCGDDGFDRNRVLRHRAFFDAARADVIQEEDAHFISGDELIASVRTLHGDADAVRIRIGGQHEIRPCFPGKGKALFQSLEDFRIRVGAGCKIAVRIFLLRNDRHIRDADIAEYTRNRYKARAVKR